MHATRSVTMGRIYTYAVGLLRCVVKVIWHKDASPPHTDGSVVFASWRQCAPPSNICFVGPNRVCIPKFPLRIRIWTLSNAWFPGSTSVGIQNGISIGSAVFAQLTYNGPPLLPSKLLLFHWRILASYHGSLGPLESTPQLRHLDRFSCFCRADDVTDRQTVLCKILFKSILKI